MEKKNIAFIELETHTSLLEQWYVLLKDMPAITFHFFLSQKVTHKIASIPPTHITLVHSFEQLITQIQDYDAVVVNTLHRYFKDFKPIFINKPSLVLVHNLNFSLLFRGVQLKNFISQRKKAAYFLKLYLKEKIAQNRKTILQATHFGVLSPALKHSLTQQNPSLAEKTIVINPAYSQPCLLTYNHLLKIVVPGNISPLRKDLPLLFSALKKLQPQAPLHIIFLGKPNSNSIIRQLHQLQKDVPNTVKISFYTTYIKSEEYAHILLTAHLLCCPIKLHTSFYGVNEYYGSTKVSGSEGDCIMSGKIGIFPATYPPFNWHTLRYKNEAALIQLLNSLNNNTLQKEYTYLEKYIPQHTLSRVRQSVETQLLTITNSKPPCEAYS